MTVAYIMSRFPVLTETFVLYEMLEIEKTGARVELYPLLRQRNGTHHPGADELERRAHFQPFLSLRILRAHWRFIRRSPRTYWEVLRDVIGGTWGSPNFFVGAMGVFPKVVFFAEEMLRGRVSHIHAHFANHPALAAMVIHRLTGIPYSFTAHGSDIHKDRRMLDRKTAFAAFVAAVSSYNKEVIVQECGETARNKVEIIHCGIDPGVFSPVLRETPPDAIHIVCVGSFIEVKGHRYLIEACRMALDRGVDIHCHLVGKGRLQRQIERQIGALGLEDRVRLHGALPRPKVAEIQQQADIAALTSVPARDGKREGIPVVLMEAMASGLPVVSSDLSGIPELVEHGRTGFLAPPRDAAAIADAIVTLASDAQLRLIMGMAGRAKVLRDFNLATNARLLLRRMERAGGAPQRMPNHRQAG